MSSILGAIAVRPTAVHRDPVLPAHFDLHSAQFPLAERRTTDYGGVNTAWELVWVAVITSPQQVVPG